MPAKSDICERGHPRTPENVDAGRHCRTCKREHYQTPEYKAAARARHQRPNDKERLRLYRQTPEYKEKERLRRRTPEHKERANRRRRLRRQTPEYKEKERPMARLRAKALRADPSSASSVTFWSHVDRSGGPDACWPWTTTHDKDGYGLYRSARANRIAWALADKEQGGTGVIPDGNWVLHRCDNPPCCNPAHLYLGTSTDNNRDTVARGRRRKAPAPIGAGA